jgi:hypothetical protein
MVVSLEERDVPAILTVNTIADTTASPQALSLRDAITIINLGSADGFDTNQISGPLGVHDTIFFDPSVFPLESTVDLTSALPTITANMSIERSGGTNTPGQVKIDAHQFGTVLTIGAGATVDMAGILLTDGLATQGGGLINNGTLTMTNGRVFGNTAVTGAGIFNSASGTLKLVDSSVIGNTAIGAINVTGGGILNNGVLSLVNSTVSNNTATGTVNITNASWALGVATITTASPHGLSIGSSVSIAGVTPLGFDGGITVTATPTPTTFQFALAVSPGGVGTSGTATGISTTSGGGISNTAGTVTLLDSTVANNATVQLPSKTTSLTVTGATWAAGVATITTGASHGLKIGDRPTILGVTPTPYNGTFTVTAVPTANTFQFALATDPSTATTTGGYAPANNITGATWGAGVATFTTAFAVNTGSGPFALTTGQPVTIAGVTPNGYNGTFIVTSVPTSNTFTVALGTDPGLDGSATGGLASSITSASWFNGFATITTMIPTGLTVGQMVTVAGVTPNGYNGTFVITATTANTLTYALATNPGTFSTVLALSSVASASWGGGFATITTTLAHGLTVGQSVTIAGVNPTAYNGTFTVLTTPTPNTFTFALTTNPGLAPAGGGFIGLDQVSSDKWAASPPLPALPNTATITTVGAPQLPILPGSAPPILSLVIVGGAIPPAYNGTFAVTGTTSSTFTYTLATNPATSTGPGTVSISTSSSQSTGGGIFNAAGAALTLTNSTVTGNASTSINGTLVTRATWAGNVATITTATPHGLLTGLTVNIAGISPNGFNGTFVVSAVTSSTTFQVAVTPNPGPYVGGGTVGVGGTTSAGGIANNSTLTVLQNSIVAGNSNEAAAAASIAPAPPPLLTPSDIAGTMNVNVGSSLNNLIGTGGSGGLTSSSNGNIVNVATSALGLGPLADNAGLTRTVAVLPGSPALNNGTAVALTTLGGAAAAGDPGVPLTALTFPVSGGPGFADTTLSSGATSTQTALGINPENILSPIALAGAALSTDTKLAISSTILLAPGQLLRFGSEVVQVVSVNGSSQITVLRGAAGTTATNLTNGLIATFVSPGPLLRIGTEEVRVVQIPTNTTLIVSRGQNGTTATTLTAGTGIDLVRAATLSADATATDTTLKVASTTGVTFERFLQLGTEIVQVIGIDPVTSTIQVLRGQVGTSAVAQPAGTAINYAGSLLNVGSTAQLVPTTLTAPAAAGDTTLTVGSSALLSVGEQLRLSKLIVGDYGTEIVQVQTIVDATHITVLRGQNGTTASAYPSGTPVNPTTLGQTLRIGTEIVQVLSALDANNVDVLRSQPGTITTTAYPVGTSVQLVSLATLTAPASASPVTPLTTLSAPALAGDTTLKVGSATVLAAAVVTAPALPSDLILTVSTTALLTPNELLKIGNEIVAVANVIDGTHVGVFRAQNGTKAVMILAGAPVNSTAPGEFLRLGNEIVQVVSVTDANTLVVTRAQAGTFATDLPAGTSLDLFSPVTLGAVALPGDPTLTVSDASVLSAGEFVSLGTEIAQVQAIVDPTHVSVLRGQAGTGAGMHALGSSVLPAGATLTVSDTRFLTVGSLYRLGSELVTVLAIPDATHVIVLRGQDGTTFNADPVGTPLNLPSVLTVASSAPLTVGQVYHIGTEFVQVLAIPDATHIIVLRGQGGTTTSAQINGAPLTQAYDQRGFARAVGQVDIGSYELQSTLALTPPSSVTLGTGQSYSLIVSATGGSGIVNLTYTITGTLPAGITVTPSDGSTPFTGTVTISGTALGPGAGTVNVIATDEVGNRVGAAYSVNYPGVTTSGGGGTSGGGSSGGTSGSSTAPAAPAAPAVNLTPNASVAIGPSGLVIATVNASGTLNQTTSLGTQTVRTGVQSASVAFGPAGLVMLVTTTDGALIQSDAFGTRTLLGSGVLSGSIAYGPHGQVLLIALTNGALYRIDSSGIRLLFAGDIKSASVGFGPGGEVMLVTTMTGALYSFDKSGIHFLLPNVNSATVTFTPAPLFVAVLNDGTLAINTGSGFASLGFVS